MRIGIELNGVLRDTIGKFRQVYEKHLVEQNTEIIPDKIYDMDLSGNTLLTQVENTFEYKILSDVTSLNLIEHFAFKDSDELYNFMYKDHTMEIFGHAGSVENSGMMDFNNFYMDMRDKYDILIVSDEIGKSKPASLFFISKFGCLVETVKFYSEITINSMWDSVDVLLTANPKLLLNHPENKTVIKYNTNYNSDILVGYEISTIKQLKSKIEELYD
jgi:hypothetical protein